MDLSFLQPAGIQEAKNFLQQLGLRDNEHDTRAKILSCWESVDIPSCPGSGKTTILVTKLAWAIERWRVGDIGICVLSHTNVAKDEIKKRLTSNQANKLLGYPHFVGTIHEFFNRFLAIPFLRTKNIPIKYIDNDIAYQKCAAAVWKVGPGRFDSRYRKNFIHQNHVRYESLTKLNWQLDAAGEVQLSSTEKDFSEFQRLIKNWGTMQGYHTHDDMIAFSARLLFQYQDLAIALCSRFPLVLIDEAQDTSEEQSRLLRQLFDSAKTVVQRFGDNDQQIFGFGEQATTDPFSIRARPDLQLEETQRCSTTISAAANKFSLSGMAMRAVAGEVGSQLYPHLILFDQRTASRVILKFAELVDSKLHLSPNDVIKVIGQIGMDTPDDRKFPHTICHYEPTYTKPTDKRIGRPKNLRALLTGVKEIFAENANNFQALNLFFSGIVRLIPDYLEIGFGTVYPFRDVRDKLAKDHLNSGRFDGKDLFKELLVLFSNITHGDVDYDQVKTELEKLLKRDGFDQYTESFLSSAAPETKQAPNQIWIDHVPVELNTIAGAKGETHTATLVLETFWKKHNVENAIRAVFDFEGDKKNESTQKRIKHLYVAMTRPTKFLCLAMPKSKYEALCKSPSINEWFSSSFDPDGPSDLTLEA